MYTVCGYKQLWINTMAVAYLAMIATSVAESKIKAVTGLLQ